MAMYTVQEYIHCTNTRGNVHRTIVCTLYKSMYTVQEYVHCTRTHGSVHCTRILHCTMYSVHTLLTTELKNVNKRMN